MNNVINNIRLYYLTYQDESELAIINDAYVEKWLSMLPLTRQSSISRMIHKSDRLASLFATRLLLMCAQHENITGFSLDKLRYPQRAKPYWNNVYAGFFDFNISHTDKLIVVATSTSADVGVDAEKIRKLKNLKFKMVLSPEELAEIKRNPGLFFELWSKKEAVVKAANTTGIGRMRDVELKQDYAILDDRKWYIRRIDLGKPVNDNYAVYVASSGPVEKIIQRQISISEIL